MFLTLLIAALVMAGCGIVPVKKYYLLNYIPMALQNRLNETPYPSIIRLKDLSIEEAYARPQIVYRQNAYQLQFYFYQVWAVKPARMINDLIFKHLVAVDIARGIVRRYDGGEYDSDQVWFAHMALRFQLTRTSDGQTVYSRRFDKRKRVFKNDPQSVVKEMSSIMEFIMNQVVGDLDQVLDSANGQRGVQ